LLALAVDLYEHIRGNHICLILFVSSVLELDLVFTSVEQSPRAFNHASASFVVSTHVLDQFNLEVLGNDSIVLCRFGLFALSTSAAIAATCAAIAASSIPGHWPLRDFHLCCYSCSHGSSLGFFVSIHVPIVLWVGVLPNSLGRTP
jgi:hypothetical protein